MKTYLNHKPVKIILFDVDGTFYPAIFYIRVYYKFLLDTLYKFEGLKEDKARELLSDYGIYDYFDPEAKSGTDFMVSRGMTLEEWNEYRTKYYVLTGFKNQSHVTMDVLESLAASYPLYIVSNNELNILLDMFNEMDIDPHIFTKMYTSIDMQDHGKKLKKDVIFKRVHDETGIDYENMLAVGDRYAIDIEPLISLGGQGIQVDTPEEISLIKSMIEGE